VLTADDLIDCYRNGVFPMGETRDDPKVMIVEPHLRGVIDPLRFHIPKRLARVVRRDAFQVSINGDFDGVVAACAAQRPGRLDTWINAPIRKLYGELHERGLGHSVECRVAGELVGGLYGIALGAMFFGESMFSARTDASKVALVHLIAHMRVAGYRLLDCQFNTPHLSQFGAEEIEQAEYLRRLRSNLIVRCDFAGVAHPPGGASALQLINHAS
jgi:leucyl/phenylalanyl-tRNA--protein transferase